MPPKKQPKVMAKGEIDPFEKEEHEQFSRWYLANEAHFKKLQTNDPPEFLKRVEHGGKDCSEAAKTAPEDTVSKNGKVCDPFRTPPKNNYFNLYFRT